MQWKDAKPEDLMDSKLRCVFEMPAENEKTVSGWVFMCFLMLALSCRQCVKWQWQQAWLHSCHPLLKLSILGTFMDAFAYCCVFVFVCEPDFGRSMKWKAIRYPPVSQSRNHPHCLWSPWPPVWMMERWRRSWRNVKDCRRRCSGYERRTNRSGWVCLLNAFSQILLSAIVINIWKHFLSNSKFKCT